MESAPAAGSASSHSTCLLAKDGRLYILCDNGLLRCVRAGTGEPIWQERLPARFYASPVWAENRLYLTSKAGEVFVVAAGDKYQLLAQNTLGEPSFATPAVANGVYSSGRSRVF